MNSTHTNEQQGGDAPASRDVYSSSGILEASGLHKILVGLDQPNGWPLGLVAAAALLPILACAGLWWLAAGPAWAALMAAGLLVLAGGDALILRSLPRLQLSFGPARSQFFILLVARLVLAALGALAALAIGPAVAAAGALGLNLAGSLALAWGSLVEPRRVGVSRLSLPAVAGARPLRVLQISDLHVERFGRREEHLLALVEELHPDLIAVTGDYVNLSCVDDPAAHAAARRVLERLSAPAGVFAVLGSPPVDRNSASTLAGLPIRLLRDETALVELPGGGRLALVGVDCSHEREEDERVLARLVAGLPADAYRILLYHSPDLMPAAPRYGIDLYLCGHTHGGQIRLPFYGALVTSSIYGKRFEMGHYQSGATHLYVSRGVGLEGLGAPRVRFLCRPEIVLFTFE